jgi:hypothetical protein
MSASGSRYKALTLLGLLLWSSPAAADVSSWLYVGGGPGAVDRSGEENEQQPTLQLDTGLGTPPKHALAVGGLFRMHTHFGLGTDVALLARTATFGFNNGDWGAAVDLGGYRRWWGETTNGLLGSLALGGPWGVTLSLTAGLGSDEAKTFAGTLGIDFARLTVYRLSGDSWWKNPFPAVREGG